MTEARHQKREAQRDESTLKCVLAIILAVVALFASRIVRPLALALGLDTLVCSMVARAILSVSFIIILGGASWLTFNPKKVSDTWKYCRPVILINVVLGLLVLYSLVSHFLEGSVDVASAPYWFLYATVICFLVGVNEEGIFRGLLMGGLLAKLGDKKGGLLIAALVSSLAFGVVHVISDMDFSNAFAIGTGFLKALETAMFAFILCAPVVQGKNLWGVMTVHAFTDWVILCGSAIRSGGMSVPTYVSTDPEHARSSMIVFALLALLYLPKAIRAFKDLRAAELPQYGPFVEK